MTAPPRRHPDSLPMFHAKRTAHVSLSAGSNQSRGEQKGAHFTAVAAGAVDDLRAQPRRAAPSLETSHAA